MKEKDINTFFEELSHRWPHKTEVLLLGGAASILLGGGRPTRDIDFEVSFRSSTKRWQEFQKVLEEVRSETGIDAQFSENASRWSQISFLDYRKHARLFKRFGKIDVRVLGPLYWSIGKITRYWQPDTVDMISVFKKVKPDPEEIAEIWLKAIKKSPPSTVQFLVKKNASDFFKKYGKKIWKARFHEEKILPLFK